MQMHKVQTQVLIDCRKNNIKLQIFICPETKWTILIYAKQSSITITFGNVFFRFFSFFFFVVCFVVVFFACFCLFCVCVLLLGVLFLFCLFFICFCLVFLGGAIYISSHMQNILVFVKGSLFYQTFTLRVLAGLNSARGDTLSTCDSLIGL